MIAVTFALQNKVLDELEDDMKSLQMDKELRNSVTKTLERMRKTMSEASDALNRNAPEDFFDSLFESSEEIIKFSILIRNLKLDDVSLALVKAVSRLGHNNSEFIQEFASVCSLVQRSPKPRIVGLF